MGLEHVRAVLGPPGLGGGDQLAGGRRDHSGKRPSGCPLRADPPVVAGHPSAPIGPVRVGAAEAFVPHRRIILVLRVDGLPLGHVDLHHRGPFHAGGRRPGHPRSQGRVDGGSAPAAVLRRHRHLDAQPLQSHHWRRGLGRCAVAVVPESQSDHGAHLRVVRRFCGVGPLELGDGRLRRRSDEADERGQASRTLEEGAQGFRPG
mmetsp:Transcript_3189/g.9039  ORF Transcript_3189/g.9039 Transcript_3189/m.9039 type:complete len:204 (-) Transcript_3189:433-1044(-)